MAGTGLPIPNFGDVEIQPTSPMDGDRLAATGSWLAIAETGRQLAAIGADAYQRAQHQQQIGYLAQADVDAQRKRLDLADENRYDPAAFDRKWSAYQDGVVSEAPGWAVPHLTRTLGNYGNETLGSIRNQAFERNQRLSAQSWDAQFKMVGQDVLSHAEAGATDTPEGKAAIIKLKAVMDSGVASRFLSQEEGDLRMERLTHEATGWAIVSNAEKAYRERGPKAALDLINGIESDKSLDLNPAERLKFAALGRQAIKTAKAADDADSKEWRDAAAAARSTLAGGGMVDESTVNETLDELQKRGLVRDWMSLRREYQNATLTRSLPGMDDAQQLDQLRRMQPPGARGTITVGAGSVRERIIWAESRGNPAAQNPLSTAAGLGQLTEGTWLQTIRQHEPDLAQGRSRAQLLALRTDASPEGQAVQRRVLDYLISDNTDALSRAGVPVNDGTLYLAHFLGAGGAVKVLKSDPNAPIGQVVGTDVVTANPFLRGMSAAGVIAWADRKMGGAGGIMAAAYDPKVVTAYRNEVASDARTMLATVKTSIEKGAVPSADDLDYLVQRAAMVGDADLADEVDKIVYRSADLEGFAQGSPLQQERRIAQIEQGGVTSAEQEWHDVLRKRADADLKAMHDDPIGQAQARRIPGADALGAPLEFGDAAKLQQGLKSHDLLATRLEQQWNIGEPVVPLRPQERQVFANTLKTGTADQRLQTLGLLRSNLSPEHYQAVLGSIVKDDDQARLIAATGAIYAKSPQVGEAVLRGLDVLKANPRFGFDPKEARTIKSIDEAIPPEVLPGNEQAREDIIGLARAYYANSRAQAGDVSEVKPSADDLSPSFDAVTGGIIEWNGHKIIAPAPGYSADQLSLAIYGGRASHARGGAGMVSPTITDADLAPATIDGKPFTAEALRASNVFLSTIGDGRYAIMKGDGAAARPVKRADGQTFILDLGHILQDRHP